MKRIRLCQFLVIAAFFGTARTPQASLLRAMSLDQLVASANAIVVGKVVSVNAAWDPSHRRILSTIEVKIEECWKGSAQEIVTIVQPGGTVGEIEMTVHGMPKFSLGERSLLFLRGHAQFQVVGMSEGKRPLSWNGEEKRWLVESPEVEGVVEVDTSGRLCQAKPTVRLALEVMHEQVRHLIGN